MANEDQVVSLRPTNLCAYARFIRFPDGTGYVMRNRLKWTSSIRDRYHKVRVGEMLDGIAYKYYGPRSPKDASELWWVLADVNDIVDPFDISAWVGRELLIPDYDRLQLIMGQ